MEFDLGWILLGLPLAFGLGWMASRLDLRQLRLENRQNPKAYFKGLNHLLNEQQDQAIDAFIEAVQHDPDTSELHFALGNLFRRRGEYERAVRVHQHLLSRADLSPHDHDRAQHTEYHIALRLRHAFDASLDRDVTTRIGPPIEGPAHAGAAHDDHSVCVLNHPFESMLGHQNGDAQIVDESGKCGEHLLCSTWIQC